MDTTEPRNHPLLPPLPEGLRFIIHTEECGITHTTRTGWQLSAAYGCKVDPFTWLGEVAGLNNLHVKSAVTSGWYGETNDSLQRHLGVTFDDGSHVIAYDTKPNPAAPSKRLAALDAIAARMSGHMWDADTMQDVADLLTSVGYTMADPGCGHGAGCSCCGETGLANVDDDEPACPICDDRGYIIVGSGVNAPDCHDVPCECACCTVCMGTGKNEGYRCDTCKGTGRRNGTGK